MPVHKVKGGWRWGKHGKIYRSRADAEKQAAAIYASGYAGDASPVRGRGGRKVGSAISPNLGDAAAYKRKLHKMVDAMQADMRKRVAVRYRSPVEQLASGEHVTRRMVTHELDDTLRDFGKRWLGDFDEAAPKLAKWFATRVGDRSDRQLAKILHDAGISVPFRYTTAMRDATQAAVQQNVALIRSIPQQYLTQVEGIVLRGVSAGSDLATVTKELEKQFGVTKRRAAFIATDQNNKVMGELSRVRQLELGITEAIWQHSGGGKHPRPTHVEAGRKKIRYKVAEGWYDPDEGKFIIPGQLPRCRCKSRPVIPGLDD